MNLIKERLMGVDPGTNFLGVAIVEMRGRDYKLIHVDTLNLKSLADQQTKLKEIFLQLQEVIEIYLPSSLAIEAPFYGKNVQSMLKLGRAQGVAMAAGMTMGLNICEYAPKKIKKAITGNGNASKEQVGAMVEHLLKVKITQKDYDATDAIATAICHGFQLSNIQASTSDYKDWSSFVKDNADRVK